eukprot:TRINITY_DN7798_c0_g1_i1.p1 TRINITY_DN7798_c0_g1~~TRINITY_DN7798_c0_g1_i1.p1  ORF type:complete len:243 (-),score=19.19 TRINITY_DN7798_c0_g1_i1:5-733(-)
MSRSEDFAAKFRLQFFKTRMCKYHLQGKCVHEDKCKFAHSPSELHRGPDLCSTSLCPQGRACTDAGCLFAHDPTELRATELFAKVRPCRAFAQGLCKLGSGCRFSHSPARGSQCPGRSEEADSLIGPCGGQQAAPARMMSQQAPCDPRQPQVSGASSSSSCPAIPQFPSTSRPSGNFADMSSHPFVPVGIIPPPLPRPTVNLPNMTDSVGYDAGMFTSPLAGAPVRIFPPPLPKQIASLPSM